MPSENNSISQGTPIFAYLRRSTKKAEQAESLIQQEDGIGNIVERLDLKKDDITYFAETYSGFENKKRKKWAELLCAIDKSKTPCVILTRDISRLSRNPTDSQAIMDRLYGDNGKKKTISRIFSLDYEKIKEWNRNTDKEDVHRALSSSYYDSLDTKRKSIQGILLKLNDHQFPYAAPKGLSKCVIGTRSILKRNEEMPIIQKAFEMKADGVTHKEISKYLKTFGGIKIGERDLTDRLFRNAIYIGEYTERNTGVFNTLDFFEKEPPIARLLWDKVQSRFGKKSSQYGEKQEGHILSAKIKSESGHIFSKYNAKGKYPAYKGKFKAFSGEEEFIHIPETAILKSFMKTIGDMILGFSEKVSKTGPVVSVAVDLLRKENAEMNTGDIYNCFKEKEAGVLEEYNLVSIETNPLYVATNDMENKHILGREGRAYFLNNGFSSDEAIIAHCRDQYLSDLEKGLLPEDMDETEYRWKMLIEAGSRQRIAAGKDGSYNAETGYEPDKTITRTYNMLQAQKKKVIKVVAVERISEMLRKQFDENSKGFREVRDGQVRKLEKQKESLVQERKNYRREALKMGYSREEIDEASDDIDKDIKAVESQISEISQSSEMEGYLERLPEMLLKTVELGSKCIGEAKIEGFETDLKKLLEITTVELTVTNKKELRIKLFDVLDALLRGDKSVLEAPSGVEPLSTALQAAV